MNKQDVKVLRLGDGINYPEKGEIVGVHYVLRDEYDQVMEDTREWGQIFQWRVGSASVLKQLDAEVRNISLGGKERIRIVDPTNKVLVYELQLMYIRE